MLKKIIIATAVSGLALTSALAQSTTTPSNSPTANQSQTAPSMQTAPSSLTQKPAGAATTGEKASFVTSQTADQHLASKFKGTDVIGANDEKIGDVNDILFDKENKILAYIVGVGGFLGIGAKDVALAPASFQVIPGKEPGDAQKLRLSMTKDELKTAAAFEPYHPPRPVATAPSRPMGAPPPTGSTGSTPKQ